MIMTYIKHINESGLATIPDNAFCHLYMVTPEPPKRPYLAYHDGKHWQQVLTTAINEHGERSNTYIDGTPRI